MSGAVLTHAGGGWRSGWRNFPRLLLRCAADQHSVSRRLQPLVGAVMRGFRPREKRAALKKVPISGTGRNSQRSLRMYLVRFYLPLRDNAGSTFPAHMFRAVETELSGRFGGVTAHLQSPASGLWHDGGEVHVDDVVIFEVLSQEDNRDWWSTYRARLAHDFRQKSILLMLQRVEVV